MSIDLLYKFVDSLKWPILIGLVLYGFRDQIKKLLSGKVVVKHSDTSIELQSQAEIKVEESKEIRRIESGKTEAQLTEIIEKKNSEVDKDQQIFKLKLEKHFEYTYRIIFRSQISLLQSLQAFTDGFSIIQVTQHFENTKKLFEVFNNWTIDGYLKFLYDQNLIQKDLLTSKVTITSIGDIFLKYLVLNNYNIFLEKNL